MQGIFLEGYRRPKSKKEVKEAIAADPDKVMIEQTSLFNNEYGGPVSEMPDNVTITFVGPDPQVSRKFYGNIKRTQNGFKVT